MTVENKADKRKPPFCIYSTGQFRQTSFTSHNEY